VITHDHSPYSYDACDKNGLVDGKPDPTCLDHLRASLCTNHIDFVFLSDHPGHMAEYEFSDLLLKQSGDTLLSSADAPYANLMAVCADGFKSTILAGFESELLALGMTRHLTADVSARNSLYSGDTRELRDQLGTQADALVMIPHTESRTISLIESLAPDGIEIYNIHANLDPKIRKKYLEIPPFKHMAGIVTYLMDPYKELNPDYSFLGFFEIARVYFQKWNQLIFDNVKVTGLAGTDAHENTFPQTVADGERFDSHRRLSRLVSNYVLVKDEGSGVVEPSKVKLSLKQGKSWVVVEGLGIPSGADYSATVGNLTVGTGESLSLAGGNGILSFKAPAVYGLSSSGVEPPLIRLQLHQVMAGGQDRVIASSTGADLSVTVSTPGAYRAQIYITPKHLKPLLGEFSDRADSEFPWIVTNHIYLTP
jgi:hypothetical protein